MIGVPSASSSTLAKVHIETPVKGSATLTQTRDYSLCSRLDGPRSRIHEKRETDTQLIAMGGGYLPSDVDSGKSANREGESMQVLLPHSQSRPGRYLFGELASRSQIVETEHKGSHAC